MDEQIYLQQFKSCYAAENYKEVKNIAVDLLKAGVSLLAMIENKLEKEINAQDDEIDQLQMWYKRIEFNTRKLTTIILDEETYEAWKLKMIQSELIKCVYCYRSYCEKEQPNIQKQEFIPIRLMKPKQSQLVHLFESELPIEKPI